MGSKAIVLLGTPGTGKTEVSRILCRALGAIHIDTSSYAIASCLIKGFDTQRDTYVVDIDTLKLRLNALIRTSLRQVVVEGHYLILRKEVIDSIFILRTHPNALYERLRRARHYWSERKIIENVAAEYVGVCVADVLDICRDSGVRCCEINTTGRSPGKIAKEILDALEGGPCREPPSIDWLGARVRQELLNDLIRYF